MSYLLNHFNITDTSNIEVAVKCPFDHKTSGGHIYKESNPSASVNTDELLFYCQACGRGGDEVKFIMDYLGCKLVDAKKIKRCFENDETLEEWNKIKKLDEHFRNVLNGFGISDEVISELNLMSRENSILFPVFMYDHLMDIRTYTPGGSPKVKSRISCPTGLVIPYDIWIKEDPGRVTLLCAGEKDMAVARSHGFNAITLTGGEQTIPRQINMFKDRTVYIVYDNDDAGLRGAYKVGTALKKVGATVKVVTGFHEGMEESEDITDYFTKYEHSKEDLIKHMNNTPLFEEGDLETEDSIFVSLLEATKPKFINKTIQSKTQIVAVSELAFTVPTYVIAEKLTTEEGTMLKGDVREWALTEEHSKDLLYLIDNNITEAAINKKLKSLMNIPEKEKGVKIDIKNRERVFKCVLTDMFETNASTEVHTMEFTAYSIGVKLESGKKYTVDYKLIPHPLKGQQLTMIIWDAEKATDSVTSFKITPEVIKSLNTIQNVAKTPRTLVEKAKGLVGYDGNDSLILTIDLAYHTPLTFNFGNQKGIRAYLDTLVIGESRTGKSSTANALRETYGLGTFSSLAGNAATIPGLIGGSNKTAGGGYQTRAGVIPQNHRSMVIFEELGKSNNSIITELTDIRSSNEVRITRVSGTITMPAMVRMIALTNPKTRNGNIQSISSYPNGITILKDLIPTAEDIARYDIVLIMKDRGAASIDPLWQPEEPFPEQVYRDKIRWIWSRSAEQIIFDDNVERYIIDEANRLNKSYDAHIKLFGTEAWKKLARTAIAFAGYLVSTDHTYEHIIVKQEHVDLASKYLVSLYDNSVFRLKEYVEYERKFSTTDELAVEALQEMYTKDSALVRQLSLITTTNRNALSSATGLEGKELSAMLRQMSNNMFIRFQGYDITPTERFRKTYNLINKDVSPKKLGDENVTI